MAIDDQRFHFQVRHACATTIPSLEFLLHLYMISKEEQGIITRSISFAASLGKTRR